jgi:hypothetical protein
VSGHASLARYYGEADDFLCSAEEQRLRERAHAIWEAEGRPEGRDAEHWREALSEVERERKSLRMLRCDRMDQLS